MSNYLTMNYHYCYCVFIILIPIDVSTVYYFDQIPNMSTEEEIISNLRKENEMLSRTVVGLEQQKNKFSKFLYVLKNKTLRNLHLRLSKQSLKLTTYLKNEKEFVTTKCRLYEKSRELELELTEMSTTLEKKNMLLIEQKKQIKNLKEQIELLTFSNVVFDVPESVSLSSEKDKMTDTPQTPEKPPQKRKRNSKSVRSKNK